MSKTYDPYIADVVTNKRMRRFIRALVKVGLRRGKAIIILVERQRHVRLLGKDLAKYKPALVYGPVSHDERTKIIRKFEKGKCSLIIASVVFTKGVNVKRVDMIIDAAQRKSRNDAMQKLGRGVRLHADKVGLLYFCLWTAKSKTCKKSATSRRTAFKRAQIPVVSESVEGVHEDEFKEQVARLIVIGEERLNGQNRSSARSKGKDRK